MKYRAGWVANSSSNSFVVGFLRSRIPTTIEEVKSLLFPKGFWGGVWDGDGSVSLDRAAEAILGDIQEQGGREAKGLSIREVFEGVVSGHFPGTPKMPGDDAPDPFKDRDGWDAAWNEYTRKKRLAARRCAKTFRDGAAALYKAEAPGEEVVFLKFCYSDEDGHFYSALEHGDTFAALPHVAVSHH